VAVFSLSLTQGEIPSHTPPNAEPVNSSAAIACEHAAFVGAVLVQHDWLPPTCTRMDGEIEKMDASRRTPSCLQALASAGFLAGTVFFAASSCQILGLPLPHLQRDRTYPCPTSIKRRIGNGSRRDVICYGSQRPPFRCGLCVQSAGSAPRRQKNGASAAASAGSS
jgi:hypothetical protein